MAKKTYRLQKRVGSKARIIKPYKIKKTGFEDIGLYARFPWHQTFLDPFVGGWSVALNHPCFDQEVWNTRTIPVIAVNDINSGIIDLAWCLLYIPFNFKMTVKNAIHCQGLWNECRDKALLDRFRSALRFYYSLEANFHKQEFEEGLREHYRVGNSFGGRKIFGYNTSRNRVSSFNVDKSSDTPMGSVEDGIRKFYENEASYGGSARGFWIRQNMNRQLGQQLRGVPEEEIEEGFRRWYQKTHSFGGFGQDFQYDINGNRGCLHQGEPLGPEVEDALRSWYLSQHSYGSRKAFRFSQNVQRNMNVGSERGEIDPSFEKGMQNWYRQHLSYAGSSSEDLRFIRNKNIWGIRGKGTGTPRYSRPIPHKKDYYDEIHGRLRWMQIFNEDFARNFKRFIGKMDHGFIYGDPTYFKTLTGKHYEDVLSLKQHQELADLLHEADKTNTKFLLSYDVDERVDKLYSSFDFETIQVPYSVARSYGDGRAQMDEEYLIRNYNLKEDPYMKKVDFTKKTKLDQFMTGK